MKQTIKFGIVAGALAALVSTQARAADTSDIESYGWTPVGIGIATPVTLPWGFDWDVFGLDVNIFYTDCNDMFGLEVGGLANVARKNMYGLQVASCCNYVHGNAYGAQVAIVNLDNGVFGGLGVDLFTMRRVGAGLSVDGLGSGTDGNFYGLEIAGLGSAVKQDMWGFQAALGCNFARGAHGLQAALLYNQTQDLHGAQIGLVNYAAECQGGFQIGLVNIIRTNRIPVLPIVNAYF